MNENFLEIKILDDNVGQVLSAFGKDLRPAVKRALSRTMTGARKTASQAMREDYNVKAGYIREHMETRVRQDEAVLELFGGPIPLREFAPKPSGIPKRKLRKALSVEVKRGERKEVKGAFMAQMGSGHLGVFRREGQSRFPIKELYSLSVPQMFGDQHSDRAEQVQEYSQERFQREIEHEISYAMRKL